MIFSRSFGAGSATTRQTRGLSRCVMRLIAPPLPAASRPSKITTTLSFFCDDPVLQLDQFALQPEQLLEIELAVDAFCRSG